jgi:hypothetical protein
VKLFLCNDIIILATAIHGISPKTLGGDFIQEGADNIDLNTETIDRKNTMHSMARAIFQVVQDHTPTSEIISTKIKRGQDRSLFYGPKKVYKNQSRMA